ncbi:C-type lectin domain-containing protein [Caenorhabditis elegans]|uniref:C-type lectin domain-containing protein n=1 Tax=Caenorhabditis elegans TaxID=6239 RepID=Q9U2W0_CAEEL|nr:C-type lectin domain-containing protein [Caenorhabditis elegans]CAB55165.1 C-type lectin domain-containing protein [Caenorhabditis elegans]|eukprot:NP_502991.1 C-type LECtin [Caenorhabditis elegans]
MKKLIQLIACFFLLIPAASVFIRDPSFSSSSEEGYGRGKHHHGGHHSPTPNPCEVGWYAFHRPQGVWCVKVVASKLTYLAAQTACINLGGALSGLQNDKERVWIGNKGMEIMLANGGTDSGTWLGAKCSSSGCTWTDGNTVGTQGMMFAPGEPNQLSYPPCLYIWAKIGDTLKRYPYGNGYIDDTRLTTAMMSYACGKPGLRNN